MSSPPEPKSFMAEVNAIACEIDREAFERTIPVGVPPIFAQEMFVRRAKARAAACRALLRPPLVVQPEPTVQTKGRGR